MNGSFLTLWYLGGFHSSPSILASPVYAVTACSFVVVFHVSCCAMVSLIDSGSSRFPPRFVRVFRIRILLVIVDSALPSFFRNHRCSMIFPLTSAVPSRWAVSFRVLTSTKFFTLLVSRAHIWREPIV